MGSQTTYKVFSETGVLLLCLFSFRVVAKNIGVGDKLPKIKPWL